MSTEMTAQKFLNLDNWEADLERRAAKVPKDNNSISSDEEIKLRMRLQEIKCSPL
jgi:hypothetical protein